MNYEHIHFYSSFVEAKHCSFIGDGHIAIKDGHQAVLVRNNPWQRIVLIESDEHMGLAKAVIDNECELDIRDEVTEYRVLVGPFKLEAKFNFTD